MWGKFLGLKGCTLWLWVLPGYHITLRVLVLQIPSGVPGSPLFSAPTQVPLVFHHPHLLDASYTPLQHSWNKVHQPAYPSSIDDLTIRWITQHKTLSHPDPLSLLSSYLVTWSYKMSLTVLYRCSLSPSSPPTLPWCGPLSSSSICTAQGSLPRNCLSDFSKIQQKSKELKSNFSFTVNKLLLCTLLSLNLTTFQQENIVILEKETEA